MNEKTCVVCGEQKELREFYLHSTTKRPRGICRKCNKEAAKKWRQLNKDKSDRIKKDSTLRINYGVDLSWYEETLESQGGVCAICKKYKTYKDDKYMCVDHCHSSGNIRGILCTDCNTGLARFSDDVSILKNAIEYLNKNDDQH